MSVEDIQLRRQAERQGIEISHQDAFGKMVEASPQTLRDILAALGDPVLDMTAEPPPEAAGPRRRCFTMDDLGHDRLWGLTVQLYGVRSRRNWGIGDFTDLADLAEIMADAGAAAIGVNPLHALFGAEPGHCSPYSPSSRQFLNPLYIDPEAVPEWQASGAALLGSPAIAEDLEKARGAELIDYQLVASLKRRALEALFQAFLANELEPGTARGRAFAKFVENGGGDLARFACFEALHEHAMAQGLGWSWRDWPDGLADPASDAVRRFAAGHAARIAFSQYQQWLADEQLGHAQARALAAGMSIGLYRDLAVALDPAGAAAWSRQRAVASGVAVGAPPDQFNPLGQDWGLAPYSPAGLIAENLEPLRADLEANMRHAGAIRIDHVMGLNRLFWIPAGALPKHGTYIRYPLDRLLGVVAAESEARRCLVVGEDLGTVPPGFRRRIADAGLMSYRLFYFERGRSGAMKPPSAYPRNALVSVSTHDLPTLRGFFEERDLAWRDRLGLHPSEAERRQAHEERRRDLARMVQAFRRAGHPVGERDEGEVALAAHRYLAATPSRLMMVQIEDLLGEVEQANLPGTIDEHPNWRRRLAVPLERLTDQPMLGEIARIMEASGRSPLRGGRRGRRPG